MPVLPKISTSISPRPKGRDGVEDEQDDGQPAIERRALPPYARDAERQRDDIGEDDRDEAQGHGHLQPLEDLLAHRLAPTASPRRGRTRADRRKASHRSWSSDLRRPRCSTKANQRRTSCRGAVQLGEPLGELRSRAGDRREAARDPLDHGLLGRAAEALIEEPLEDASERLVPAAPEIRRRSPPGRPELRRSPRRLHRWRATRRGRSRARPGWHAPQPTSRRGARWARGGPPRWSLPHHPVRRASSTTRSERGELNQACPSALRLKGPT